MQMDEHTSEMVWTWTINELCRKAEATTEVIYGSFLSRQTDPFHEIPIVACVVSLAAESGKGKIK